MIQHVQQADSLHVYIPCLDTTSQAKDWPSSQPPPTPNLTACQVLLAHPALLVYDSALTSQGGGARVGKVSAWMRVSSASVSLARGSTLCTENRGLWGDFGTEAWDARLCTQQACD